MCASRMVPQEKEVESINHKLINKMSFFINDLAYRGLHIHKDIEVLLVLSGSIHVATPEEEFDLHTGDLAYFNPTLPHSCKSSPLEYSRLLVLQFDPSFCVEYFPAIRNLYFVTADLKHHMLKEQLERLTTICFRAATNYFLQSTGFVFKCISDLNLIMDLMLNYVPYVMIPEDAYLSALNFEDRMSRIVAYIREHYADKITLQDIADMEGLTATYLSHLFKKHLHKSFQTFVNELRMEHAIFLLKNTNMKVLDISVESGFSDSKYMNRSFISLFGVTPREFRRQFGSAEMIQSGSGTRKEETILSKEDSLVILDELRRSAKPSS